jgi:trimeric autotransporter adhesin
MPMWMTMISSAGQDANVQAINALLRVTASAEGVILIDVAEDPCLGMTGAYANPAACADFQSDGLHESQAGADSMRNTIGNVVNWATGSTVASPTFITASSHTMLAGEGYISVTPGGSTTALTLPLCIGYSTTTPFTVYNASASGVVTVAPAVGQLLNGSGSGVGVAAMGQRVFVASPLAASVGGCSWASQ